MSDYGGFMLSGGYREGGYTLLNIEYVKTQWVIYREKQEEENILVMEMCDFNKETMNGDLERCVSDGYMKG